MTYRNAIVKELDAIALYEGGIDEQITEGQLNKLSTSLSSLQSYIREQIQEETADHMKKLVRKLRSNGDVSEFDLKVIRIWMISDAAYYTQMENDYHDWLRELERLISVIKGLKATEVTLNDLGQISGASRDAMRVISDILYFKEQELRVREFEEASENLSARDKTFLANILQQKLESARM